MPSGWHRKRTDTPAEQARRAEYSSPAYREAREHAAHLVESGEAWCWRPDCRAYIAPGQPFHLGHDDNDRSIIRGVECPTCNLRAAARKGARTRNALARRRGPSALSW